MPHTPASQHATHDLELVAAFAAGDAAGPDLETATALVASCADCAALHHDLRSIAAALPAIPAPVRPRDFRLSPDQAASLHPRGLRGLLAAFASPRLSFATPLGTGLAALGIVGLLVASGGLPVGGGTSSGAAPEAAVSGNAAPTLEATLAEPPAEDAAATEAPVAGAPDGDVEAVAPTAPDGAELYGNVAASPRATLERALTETPADARRSDDQTLLILAGGLLLAGLGLVSLRWVSRRLV